MSDRLLSSALARKKLARAAVVSESLESRCLFSTFVVTSVYDSGPGTLRDAITRANAGRSASDIRFELGAGPVEPLKIRPLSPLPVITVPLTIDGTTQPDYRGRPIVEISGIAIPKSSSKPADGLRFTSRNNIVRGLIINYFRDDGIELRGGGGSRVELCYLGIDRNGGMARANGNAGIHIANSPANVVDLCVISGNTHDGVLIDSAGSRDNRITGNFIGTDRLGLRPVANEDCGVRIDAGASANYVGGTSHTLSDEDGNVISGNRDGVLINSDGSRDNRVLGNVIGTDFTGTTTDADGVQDGLGNGKGVYIRGGVGNIVGGGAAGARNVISGNGTGVRLDGGRQNGMLGNYIGTDVTGAVALGNNEGVELRCDDNFVGGAGAGEGNVISGNVGAIFADGARRNVLRGNLIGTNAAGEAAVPNVRGIFFDGAARAEQNEIVQNVISGNEGLGLWFSEAGGPGGVRNTIRGNFIGTNRSGTVAIPNGGTGIQIDGGRNNVIGGISPADRNVIAYNGGAGLSIDNGSGNTIRRNSIFANARLGIDLGDDGVTPNDATDADTGANDLQNTPVITSIAPRGHGIRVRGTLTSTPSTAFTIELFANFGGPAADAEGALFLGSVTVNTNGSGVASFTFDLAASIARPATVTATATNAAGSTSEFSAAVAV